MRTFYRMGGVFVQIIGYGLTIKQFMTACVKVAKLNLKELTIEEKKAFQKVVESFPDEIKEDDEDGKNGKEVRLHE